MGMREKIFPRTTLAVLAFVAAVALISPGTTLAEEKADGGSNPQNGREVVKVDDLKEALGVELVSLRRSAAGHILDLRYRIVDREKATPFVEGRIKPYLVDPERKLLLHVPFAQKVGKLQQVHLSKRSDYIYFMLFGNAGRLVQAGDHVTVVFGDLQIDDVVVEG